MCTLPSTQIIVLFFTGLPLWRFCEHIKQVGNIIYKSSKMSKIKIGGLLQAIEMRTWIIRRAKISTELYLKNSWWKNPFFFNDCLFFCLKSWKIALTTTLQSSWLQRKEIWHNQPLMSFFWHQSCIVLVLSWWTSMT